MRQLPKEWKVKIQISEQSETDPSTIEDGLGFWKKCNYPLSTLK